MFVAYTDMKHTTLALQMLQDYCTAGSMVMVQGKSILQSPYEVLNEVREEFRGPSVVTHGTLG